ncbi:MAG: 3'-5' exonuclease domain-containing protein 2 [Prevotellaceae bacterium]|jgi:ribonuclease D|nr:3'-5' exonuclease domain-containing protein 2 [Prevotellaceae bacterium]
MKTLKATLTKDELNAMPPCVFTGKIELINTSEQVNAAVEALKNELLIGFDTETKPSFVKGISNKVSLIQLATENVCYLFRLNHLGGIPADLEHLLQSKQVKKVGLSLRDDFAALNKRKKINHDSFIDLQKLVKQYGIEELSLQKIYGILFGERISKSQRLSNWEAAELSEAQQRYAAIDAWACWKIYLKLLEMKK